MVYVTIINHPEYEIETEYPHSIRRIGSDEPISDRGRDGNGYIQVHLNDVKYKLHRLIAEQFIPNDDPIHKTEVDHINHNRTDNHISNLRWVTHSVNQLNRSGYYGYKAEYIEYEDAPEDLIRVTDYGKYHFEDYYYSPDNNLFYIDTGVNYRVLHISYRINGSAFVYMRDVDNYTTCVYFTKFKHLYNIQ